VVTIDSTRPGTGVGTALLLRAAELARASGAGKLWPITTNDNLRAITTGR
jgi:GNAT superfamily N-acetyltransferase